MTRASRLSPEFTRQGLACERLGSPFMARLMALLARHWDPEGSDLARRFEAWEGDIGPLGASLPLRLAGGLHHLARSGKAAGLAATYPPHEVSDAALLAAVRDALDRHAGFLDQWCDGAPQTNELRRSAVLIAAAHWLTQRTGLPLRLSELGSSAALNLNFDRYGLAISGKFFGASAPALTLAPDWSGPLPPSAPIRVAERRGVDLNPLDPSRAPDRDRLLAYLWPDQFERIARTGTALDLPPAPVDRGDAAQWIETRLAPAHVGQLHLVYHTIAWQYFPPETQARAEAAIRAAGAAASAEAPLAWLGMEADGREDGAAIRLTLWPGGDSHSLSRADFHGRWIRWQPPV